MKTVIVTSCFETLLPRPTKNAQTLASEGYGVTVLAWERETKCPKLEYKDGYQIYRFRFKTPRGAKVLPFLPIWWCFEFLWLMTTHWDVVHAISYDTIPPAVAAAKLKRKPLIYELPDVYEDLRPLPRLLRNISILIDKIFMRLANAMIIADEAQIKALDGIPNDNTVVINNSAPDLFQEVTHPIQRDSTFTIFYAGALYRIRRLNLDKLFQAIRSIDKARLVVAGYGDQIEEIEKWVNEDPGKFQFIGRISYTEVLERTMVANLVVAPRKPTIINKYTTANKLFQAMMCGKPILVNKGTAMADIVEKENCGLVVDCDSASEIEKAIEKLKDDPKLCRQLGANGRRAYEQRYSWEIMRQRLLKLYHEIS